MGKMPSSIFSLVVVVVVLFICLFQNTLVLIDYLILQKNIRLQLLTESDI